MVTELGIGHLYYMSFCQHRSWGRVETSLLHSFYISDGSQTAALRTTATFLWRMIARSPYESVSRHTASDSLLSARVKPAYPHTRPKPKSAQAHTELTIHTEPRGREINICPTEQKNQSMGRKENVISKPLKAVAGMCPHWQEQKKRKKRQALCTEVHS